MDGIDLTKTLLKLMSSWVDTTNEIYVDLLNSINKLLVNNDEHIQNKCYEFFEMNSHQAEIIFDNLSIMLTDVIKKLKDIHERKSFVLEKFLLIPSIFACSNQSANNYNL